MVTNGKEAITADNTKLALCFSAGKTITFIAIGNSSTLTFFDAMPAGSGGTSNIILDAVGVSGQAGVGGVPEPATWAMLLVGFGMVGVSMRQYRGRSRLLREMAEASAITPNSQLQM